MQQLSGPVRPGSEKLTVQQEGTSVDPRGVQRDPVCRGGELVQWALHKEAFPPENRQPMFGYYLRKVWLGCCHSGYEAAGVVDVPSGGQGASLQS